MFFFLHRLVSGTTSGRSTTVRPAVRRICGPAISPAHQPNCVSSRDGRYQLQIVAQPEQQHRARYQTEGSRGAVKDRSGNGFPIVRLTGYERPAVLECFIGTDIGRVVPHMFYQACKVSGKNSTACVEKKVDGTIVIEIELRPDAEMQVTCDCVGILKVSGVAHHKLMLIFDSQFVTISRENLGTQRGRGAPLSRSDAAAQQKEVDALPDGVSHASDARRRHRGDAANLLATDHLQ